MRESCTIPTVALHLCLNRRNISFEPGGCVVERKFRRRIFRPVGGAARKYYTAHTATADVLLISFLFLLFNVSFLALRQNRFMCTQDKERQAILFVFVLAILWFPHNTVDIHAHLYLFFLIVFSSAVLILFVEREVLLFKNHELFYPRKKCVG